MIHYIAAAIVAIGYTIGLFLITCAFVGVILLVDFGITSLFRKLRNK